MTTLTKAYTKEVGSQEEMISQFKTRLANEKEEKIKMEEERCQRHLERV